MPYEPLDLRRISEKVAIFSRIQGVNISGSRDKGKRVRKSKDSE
jgi:hypothetical protein